MVGGRTTRNGLRTGCPLYPIDARSPTNRSYVRLDRRIQRFRNKLELSGTDSTLTALNNATSIFTGPLSALSDSERRCRGLFQPDNQDAGGADIGSAGGDCRRQPRNQAGSPAASPAHAERRDRRAAAGGCRRRARHYPRRSATHPGPAAASQRRQLATATVA